WNSRSGSRGILARFAVESALALPWNRRSLCCGISVRFGVEYAMLRQIADRHGTDIATVASAAMLERPGVAAVIIGARDRSHLASNAAISSLVLTAEDVDLIAELLAEARQLEGDVYGPERDGHNGDSTRKW
ncbi:hypothetical protein FSB08_40885, partial [Paraburkholderia sp. JPY432]|uniref:aldo/keto reductase n=1 Tax=Paraburkholderia youngii TaxID=2782701 RepID=UPI0015954556